MSPGVHKQPFRVVLQSPSLLVISLVLPDSWGSLFSPLVGDLRLQLPCFTAHVLRLYRFKQQEDSEGENSMRVSSTPWGPQPRLQTLHANEVTGPNRRGPQGLGDDLPGDKEAWGN